MSVILDALRRALAVPAAQAPPPPASSASIVYDHKDLPIEHPTGVDGNDRQNDIEPPP